MKRAVWAVALLAIPSLAQANSAGVAGYSGMNQTTCSSCHKYFGNIQALITGPGYLAPSQKGTYTFLLYSYTGTSKIGGLDVAASGGLLSVNPTEPTTKILQQELVHSKPKAAASGMAGFKWSFDWTAPATKGTYTLYGAGLAGNADTKTTGDITGVTKFQVSVGSCATNPDCNDNNPCTTDLCDNASKQCVNTPVAACCITVADCDDKDPCTTDKCNTLTNQCSHGAVTGCCNVDSDCNDGDVCTKDACDQATNTCTASAIAGCCTLTIPCDDGNKCTTDTCNTQTHDCTYAPIANCCKANSDCADNSACTLDTCTLATGLCVNSSIAGCCLSDADCNDSDLCTKDACSSQNTCNSTAIPGCCSSVTDCDDGNPCSTDACLAGKCDYKAVPGCIPPDSGVIIDAGPVGDATTNDGLAGEGTIPGDGVSKDASADAASSDAPIAGDSPPPADDDGCCRVTHARDGSRGVILLLVGLLLVALRRRR